MKHIMCDPPEGWKYGFPALMPIDALRDDVAFRAYLRSRRYPEDLIPMAEKYSRFWEPSVG
jgi:hypothetical protein